MWYGYHCLALLSLVVLAHTVGPPIIPTTEKSPTLNCGYKSCHPVKPEFINVHLVPHTHDDVGWLKTVDQYYYGSNTNSQNAGVQYILDTVVDSLMKDKNRRFIYVETAFFWKWWIKQHDIVKARVRNFVKTGQLEFIGGGWSMNDEATTNYQSIIDQMTWGLRKLNDTFGECGRPKIGWQIDPFGHSKEMASIFAQLGFDAVLLGRIDYQEKRVRWTTKTPEMVWQASDSLGESSDIFTGILYNTYAPPPGFCFDLLCDDEPFIDDKKSFEYNVDSKVDNFIEYLDNVTQVYTTNNVLITMGNDFNYQDAEVWFKNLDKLIYYVNQRQKNGSKYNLIYSTPSCYVKAVHDEAGSRRWPVKNDDFFPYASDPHAFWTGYFTSRPAVKRYERLGNNFLQICKQLYAMADLGPEDRVDLNVLREAMGVMQHHDAITGTEKQHVADDYTRHLEQGFEECQLVITAAVNKLLNASITLDNCPLVNISQCGPSEGNHQFMVTVYNPLSRPVSKVVRVPVNGSSFSVQDLKGSSLTTQVIPIPDFIKNIPGRVSQAENDLLFTALDVPPLGWKSYLVITKQSSPGSGERVLKSSAFNIDPYTGLVSHIKIGNLTIPLEQNFYFYQGFVGDNSVFENRSSGAYIFRPQGDLVKVTDKVQYSIHEGNVVAELHQVFNDYIKQIIRVNSIDDYVEFDWVIGPLPFEGPLGVEVITKYSTTMQSNSTFYTDSNGKQLLKRTRDFRPTWRVNLSEPVAGNYYPVTSQISLGDDSMDLAVLVDRAQGGSSLKDGELELMLHRRCLHDDAFGVGEALNETAFGEGLIVRGSHYVTIAPKHSDTRTKDIAQRRLLDTWTFVSPLKEAKIKDYTGLTKPLPQNVQILTLEPWIGFSFLLRLEHVYETGQELSQPVVVALKDLFAAFTVTKATETTLGGNQWLADNERLKFNTGDGVEETRYQDVVLENPEDDTVQKLLRTARHTVINAQDDELNVVLNPGQIRTFIIHIKSRL